MMVDEESEYHLGAYGELDRMLREHALDGADIVQQVHMAITSLGSLSQNHLRKDL